MNVTNITTIATTIATTPKPGADPIASFFTFGGLSLDPTSALLVGMFIGCIVGALYPEILQLLVPEDRGA